MRSSSKIPCLNSEGHKAFKKDKETGLIKVYQAGAKGYSDTYHRLMKKRYQVEVVETGLFGLKRDQACYNAFSIPFIQDTHGDSSFIKTQMEANWLDQTGQGDRLAEIISPKKEIALHFYRHIDPNLYHLFAEKGLRKQLELYCHLFTDSTGKVYDLEQFALRKHPIDAKLKATAKTLPIRVKPALDNGKPANGKVQLFLYFGEESTRIYQEYQQKQTED